MEDNVSAPYPIVDAERRYVIVACDEETGEIKVYGLFDYETARNQRYSGDIRLLPYVNCQIVEVDDKGRI